MPPVKSTFGIQSEACGGVFLRKQSTCCRWLFSQRNSIVDGWQNSKCDYVWRKGFHHWGYTDEPWIPPGSYFSWFISNTNTRRWNFGLTPRPHFLEGAVIHLLDKAENVGLIVGQLRIKAGWWNASLALRDYSRSNKHKDSHEESSWFLSFPPLLPSSPPLFSTFPSWFPRILTPICFFYSLLYVNTNFVFTNLQIVPWI